MSFFEDIENFEKQSIGLIIYNMVKWFNFDEVNSNTAYRGNVESGVWITIKITKGDKNWYIDGQRNDIVRRRLIEWLTNHLKTERSQNS